MRQRRAPKLEWQASLARFDKQIDRGVVFPTEAPVHMAAGRSACAVPCPPWPPDGCIGRIKQQECAHEGAFFYLGVRRFLLRARCWERAHTRSCSGFSCCERRRRRPDSSVLAGRRTNAIRSAPAWTARRRAEGLVGPRGRGLRCSGPSRGTD